MSCQCNLIESNLNINDNIIHNNNRISSFNMAARHKNSTISMMRVP